MRITICTQFPVPLPPSLPPSPAGLAGPLMWDLDKSVVEGQIVTDRVLPACVAAVVDPGTSPVTSHTGHTGHTQYWPQSKLS